MRIMTVIIHVIAALGLLNVWLVRFNRHTSYRGGSAGSMREEFAAYGLPSWFMYLIGALKIGTAIALIAGLWFPVLALPAAVLLCVLMLGAVAMHLKIRDPLTKFLPALMMLALGLAIIWISVSGSAG